VHSLKVELLFATSLSLAPVLPEGVLLLLEVVLQLSPVVLAQELVAVVQAVEQPTDLLD
jgi:hypothetical protein